MMRRLRTILVAILINLGSIPVLYAQGCPNIDVHGDQAFGPATSQRPGGCSTRLRNGFPVPDPNCTPGAFNPSVTLDILESKSFSTRCIRDKATTPEEKFVNYPWYRIRHPAHNGGPNQVCELDHVVPLELGGADTLDNIWPQCGPNGVGLNNRYFKGCLTLGIPPLLTKP